MKGFMIVAAMLSGMPDDGLFHAKETGLFQASEGTDNRPEVWMFVDPSGGCAPCNRAKRELVIADCPLRVVVKTAVPANVMANVTVYPTFYWTVRKVENRHFHHGYSGLTPLMAAFEKSMEMKTLSPEASPTPQSEVDRVIKLLPKPEIGFVEFGCGSDARWCVAAVKRWGCKATGIEIDPVRAEAARSYVKECGLDNCITIIEGDATLVDVQGDVGAAYLYEATLTTLRPKLEKLRAFASYIHQPPGLQVTKNGDSWIYTKPVRTPVAVWGGQTYNGPICGNPRCQMCNSIRSQLNTR